MVKIREMTIEEIDNEIDRLLEDNHLCISIMEDPSQDKEAYSDAKIRLAYNRELIAELTDKKMEKEGVT